MNKHFYILALSIFFITNAYSQRKNTVSVILNTKAWSISDEDKLKIPFDERFEIKGSFDESSKVTSIQLIYRILQTTTERIDYDDANKNREGNSNNTACGYSLTNQYYLAKSNNLKDDCYVHLEKTPIINGAFVIPMDPLHPNETYEFKFICYKKAGLGDDRLEKLKEEIVLIINDGFNYKKNLSLAKRVRIKKDVEKKIKSAFGEDDVYDGNHNKVDFDNVFTEDENIKRVYDTVWGKHDDLDHFFVTNLGYESKNDEVSEDTSIEDLVNQIDDGRSDLEKVILILLQSEEHQKLIQQPLNSILDADYTYATFLKFLLYELNRWEKKDIYNLKVDSHITDSYLIEILKGRAKLKGYLVEKADYPDLLSGQILLSGFTWLKNTRDENDDLFLNRNKLNLVIKYINDWCVYIEDKNSILKELDDLKLELPELYKNLYSKFEQTVNVGTIEVIETEKSAYIGLDIGYMYAPNIGSSFIFEGLNFYLVPVNKKVGFNEVQGWDEIAKRFSLAIGIAQRVGNNYNDNYKELIGVGSPFIGVGFRPTKGIRLSSGCMFYEQEHANPIITEASVNSTFFIAASIDMELKKLISTVFGI